MRMALLRRGYSATGGAEAYLRRFAAALVGAGHEPVLYTEAAWPVEAWPLPQHRLAGAASSAAGFAEAVRQARLREECDLVFSLERVWECDVFRAGDGVHAAWLERRARYEPRWQSWWRGRSRKHAALRQMEQALFQQGGARLVIANSALVQREIRERFGTPAERVAVVHNGVPPALPQEEQARLRRAVRAELGLAAEQYVVLFAGSGWERKGLRFALQALEGAAAVQPTLLVAGEGRRRGLPISARARYLGPVRGLARYLAAADAFILPTLYDPFSNACLEALAAGLPVITTRANGFSEILEEGEGSVVSEPHSVDEVAQAILKWSDPDFRAAARPRLLAKGARFSVEENLRATLAAMASAGMLV